MTADTCPRCGATAITVREIRRVRAGVQCDACDDKDEHVAETRASVREWHPTCARPDGTPWCEYMDNTGSCEFPELDDGGIIVLADPANHYCAFHTELEKP